MSLLLNDITRVVSYDYMGFYIVNEEIVIKEIEPDFLLVKEWLEHAEEEDLKLSPSEAELAIAEPIVQAKKKRWAWKYAGKSILEEVSFILAKKAPTPAEGLANLTALETVDKLLGRGDLRVAKAALEAADLTGTSFDGDTDSYDYVVGLLDTKIAELTA